MSDFDRIERYGIMHVIAFNAAAVYRAVEIRSAQ